MATITGTPLNITAGFGQGAFTLTTATDLSTEYRGAAANEHPTGSDFQWFDFAEDDHYNIEIELPTSVTNNTDTTSQIELTLNNVMLCFRNNVTNYLATDRIFGFMYLFEKYTEGGVEKRKLFPAADTSDNIFQSGDPGGPFDNWVDSHMSSAQKDLTKQFFTTNYQADTNGLQEPFPLATSSPHSYTDFDHSALEPKQKFKLSLKDMTGWDGKFNSGSEYYIGFHIRVNQITYGSEAFAWGVETIDVKTSRDTGSTTTAVTKSTTASPTTAFSINVPECLVASDVRRATTTIMRPYTSKATIQKGAGTFNDGSGDNAKHYNIFPYLVRGLTGSGGVNRGTGIPTRAVLDKLNILQIGEYSDITKIEVEIDIDNQTVATSNFINNANLSGYSGSQKGGYIGCNIRFDNTNQVLSMARSLNTGLGILIQEAAPQEIQSTGEATYTFTFYNSGNALTTQTGNPATTVNVTPNNIRNLTTDGTTPLTGTAEEISFGIHFTHEGHGMLGSEANNDEGLFRYVNDVRVKIEYTGKTNFETGFRLWPNTTFPGKNTTGSSDYENIDGARTLVNVLTNGLTNTTDTSIRGFMFNQASPPDALTTDDTLVSSDGTASSGFIPWGHRPDASDNDWIKDTKQIFDKNNDGFEIAASSDSDDFVFNFAWRHPLTGVANSTSKFTTTATPVLFHRQTADEMDTISTAFNTGSTLAGFLLHDHTIGITPKFTTTFPATAGIGLLLHDFTISPTLKFTTAFDGDLAITGTVISLGSFTLTNTALGTIVAHTTGASGSIASDLQMGLAGRIRTGFTTAVDTAIAFADLASSDVKTIQQPHPQFVFTTQTTTRDLTLAARNTELAINTSTRTITLPATTTAIAVDTQTRTIPAEVLDT